MMKKLSRIALLAAASVFMLAVFPACGDDDGGNDDPKATLTLVGDAVELEIGAEKTVEATVTVENDTFSDNAQKIQQGEPIPKAYFELKATDATKVTVSEATVKAWDGKTKATITFTVTAAEGAAAGKISAEIKADTLTSNATLTTTGNIAYTINGAGDGQENNTPDIFEVDITKLPFSVTNSFVDSEANNKNGKYKFPAGRTDIGIDKKYFTLVQGETMTSSYYTSVDRKKINAIELGKQSDGIYIEFTVTGKAEVTVKAGSTGGSNTSYVAIVKESEEGTFDNAKTVTGTSATEIKENCEAGTYRIVVVSDSTRKSNARITLLKAVQTEN